MKVWKFQKIKKIQKSLIFASVKIWERNSVLKKSKNPLIPLCGSLKIWGNKTEKNYPKDFKDILDRNGFLDFSEFFYGKIKCKYHKIFWRSRIFGFFSIYLKFSNFHTKELKDFWIFFKKNFLFRIFTLVKIKDFWIFLLPEIFKLPHNELKDFWIFSK